jgi:hypothetical protein
LRGQNDPGKTNGEVALRTLADMAAQKAYYLIGKYGRQYDEDNEGDAADTDEIRKNFQRFLMLAP